MIITNITSNNQNRDFQKLHSLQDFLNEKIPYCEEVKILTGFFYFSAVDFLIYLLKKNTNVKIKILVGLQVDVINHTLIEFASQAVSNKLLIRKKFIENFTKPFQLKEFDTSKFEEQANFFIDLIDNGRLEIRKTLEDNHAKLFILKMNEESKNLIESIWITGSSNFTKPGLKEQQELNVAIGDWGHKEVNEYFDNLWNTAVTLKEEDLQEVINSVKNKSLLREITPFEAYLLILYEYLSLFDKKEIKPHTVEIMENAGYKPYAYQLDAIGQALTIIEKFNGVIIADVVGLGKSVIASSVAKEIGKRGIVIAPPGLIGDEAGNYGWKKYLSDFKLNSLGWNAYSSGKLQEIKEIIKRNNDIEVVIVDEAHRFRNEETESYALLHEICRNKKVILLTATPFNNSPKDIYALLKLFIIPKKSPITLDSNLEELFRKLENKFKNLRKKKKPNNSNSNKELSLISQEIKYILNPVMIRRNRLDLIKHPDYKKEVKNLSKVKDPVALFFNLTKKQSEFYDKVIKEYFSYNDDNNQNNSSQKFIGAIYQPYLYKKNSSQSPDFEETYQHALYDLMRRLLVKRFESSFTSFLKSIENFISIHQKVLQFVEKNQFYILDRSWINKVSELEDEPEKYLEELNKKLAEIQNQKPEKINAIYYEKQNLEWNKFILDIKKDIDLFKTIQKEFKNLNLIENDPKGDAVAITISEILNNNEQRRKILIFSEFKDTITGVYHFFEKEYPKIAERTLLVDTDISKSLFETILSNFDASYPKEKQKNDYDILLCTDKLSEGFNLNRAGAIINYDIPWNPVRVIQRLGRINRIGKKVFDELFIYNFFPTIQGESVINQQTIAQTKMFLIHNAIGEDSKIFSPDEVPSPSELFQRINTNPENLEEENILTKIYIELEELKRKYPNETSRFLAEYRIGNIPLRIKTAKPFSNDELITMIKDKNLYFIYFDYNQETPIPLSFDQIWDKIKCTPNTPTLKKSYSFWQKYQESLKFNFDSKDTDNENSNRRKAINTLKSCLSNEKFKHFEDKINYLIQDLNEYGTLPSLFIRQLANLNTNSTDEFEKLLKELGDDFFVSYDFNPENRKIIVSIENLTQQSLL